ncbi:hypothetical protein, partial [Candidatus Raskinella chloraquaticus]|uniref:hypothetical protein n=1 Tax=Candidatus Raskinella chloraquaticus TaxID=1951219 RepID=UPI003672542C
MTFSQKFQQMITPGAVDSVLKSELWPRSEAAMLMRALTAPAKASRRMPHTPLAWVPGLLPGFTKLRQSERPMAPT